MRFQPARVTLRYMDALEAHLNVRLPRELRAALDARAAAEARTVANLTRLILVAALKDRAA